MDRHGVARVGDRRCDLGFDFRSVSSLDLDERVRDLGRYSDRVRRVDREAMGLRADARRHTFPNGDRPTGDPLSRE